jgi:hypothetical protein
MRSMEPDHSQLCLILVNRSTIGWEEGKMGFVYLTCFAF